jgi:Zn-dependent M28 family amino/carboxypeptidase
MDYRAFKHGDCKNAYTVILVAFDMEETGTQGATAFVQDFLIKSILEPMQFPEFQACTCNIDIVMRI